MRIFQSLIFLLAIGAVASAQSIDAELVGLREFLQVPASTPIVPSTAALPNETPLKVYVATGPDDELQKVFLKRISEWNKKNGAKFGSLEVVPDISAARIILAWYAIPIEKITHPPDDTPAAQRPCCPERAHSYLLVRTADRLEIVRRVIIEGYSNPTDADQRGNTLRAELFKLMKARKRD